MGYCRKAALLLLSGFYLRHGEGFRNSCSHWHNLILPVAFANILPTATLWTQISVGFCLALFDKGQRRGDNYFLSIVPLSHYACHSWSCLMLSLGNWGFRHDYLDKVNRSNALCAVTRYMVFTGAMSTCLQREHRMRLGSCFCLKAVGDFLLHCYIGGVVRQNLAVINHRGAADGMFNKVTWESYFSQKDCFSTKWSIIFIKPSTSGKRVETPDRLIYIHTHF